jgi:hypothetical protein
MRDAPTSEYVQIIKPSPISVVAANYDGLRFPQAIQDLVIGPDTHELGTVVGATRSDGWTWLRVVSPSWKAEDHPLLEAPSSNSYCIHEDRTFLVHPADLQGILRDGIEGYECKRLSGSTLRTKQQNWIRLLFEGNPGWPDLDPFTTNFTGIEGDLVWSVDLSLEELLPTITSLGDFAERPPSLHAVKAVVARIIGRWHRLIDLLKQNELVAVGRKNGRWKRLSSDCWSRKEAYVDIPRGGYGSAFDREEKLIADWCDLLLLEPTRQMGLSSSRTVRHRRGPKPLQRTRVENDMRSDIHQGNLTENQLAGMKEKQLEKRYSASRDTCRKARHSVLPKI